MADYNFSPYAMMAKNWKSIGFDFGLADMNEVELLREPLVLNALCAPINDALKAWRVLDEVGHKVERRYKYQDVVHDALLLSKIKGSTLVIPITNGDIKTKVRGNSVVGFQVVDGRLGEDGFYKIKAKDGAEIDVHAENVHEVFSGNGFRTKSLRGLGLIEQSELDVIAGAYTLYKKGLQEVFYLMKRAIVDIRGITDLAQSMEDAATDEQKIDLVRKLKAVHAATNDTDNHTGVVYDLELEKIERLSIASSLGGVVQSFEQLKNNFIASVGIPEVKIFGSQVGGIGNNDASTLSIYYDKVEQLLQTSVYDILSWMDEMLGITFGEFAFGSVRVMTEQEKVNIEKTQADIDNIYFNMFDTAIQGGILKRIEERYGVADGYKDADTESAD